MVYKIEDGVMDLKQAYLGGAAVAFGIMGMALAIKERTAERSMWLREFHNQMGDARRCLQEFRDDPTEWSKDEATTNMSWHRAEAKSALRRYNHLMRLAALGNHTDG